MLTSLRLNPDLLKVPRYTAGRSIAEVQEHYGLTDVVKMASNENALGASPLAVEAARQALAEAHLYPGTADRDLRRRIAQSVDQGLDERHVILGNGATDLIRMLAQAFVFGGGEMLTASVTFPMYFVSTSLAGGVSVRAPLTPDMALDLDAMAERIGPETRLCYVCSPNNPTGLTVRKAEFDAFLARVPEHVVVVIDESYRGFVEDDDPPDPWPHILAGRNLIVLRTFSKLSGLANLRVGYAFSTPEIIDYLARAQMPFHVNTPSLAAAMASLDDDEFHANSRAHVLQERKFLGQALTALGIRWLPSQANFMLLTHLPLDAEGCFEALLRRGIIVRPMGGWGVPNAIRVSLGTRRDNLRFLAALREMLDGVRPRD